jgi:hypothetical protein
MSAVFSGGHTQIPARGSDLCVDCAESPRGRAAREDPEEKWRRGYRVGEDFDGKTRLQKAIHYWQTGRRMTAEQVRKVLEGRRIRSSVQSGKLRLMPHETTGTATIHAVHPSKSVLIVPPDQQDVTVTLVDSTTVRVDRCLPADPVKPLIVRWKIREYR